MKNFFIILISILSFIFNPYLANADNKLINALKFSDNFDLHKEAFIKHSKKILDSGKCSFEDFKENGGWAKATGSNAQKPVYFIYCGGFTLKDKLYLNISNGKVWK